MKRYGLLVVIISRKRREKVSAWFAAIKSFLGVIVRKRLDSRFITTFVLKRIHGIGSKSENIIQLATDRR